MTEATTKGKVILVGAGPGDPDLITVKAVKALRQAEVVVYDRLANPRLLEELAPGAEKIYVGKAADKHTLPQDQISELLVKLAQQGRVVVRLKGGDPFVFGRGGEEIIVLARNNIAFEVIPGVSSAVAVPAYAGIPVTHRGLTSSLGIFTGQEDPAKSDSGIAWDKIATGLGTLVFLMGVENLANIVRALMKFGRPASTPCALIHWGTLPQQKTVCATLATIVAQAKKETIVPPAILVVGEVVSLRERMNWFESRPLFAKKVLVTVPAEDGGRLRGMLEELGAACLETPLIRIAALSTYSSLDKAIRHCEKYQWLIFTSQNGVRFFRQRLEQLKKDVRCLKGIKIGVIGPRTADAVQALGIRPDIQPRQFTQEGLLEILKKQKIKGQHLLLVRAQQARDVLPQGLQQLGARVTVIPAYRTEISGEKPQEADLLKDLDLVTFSSSSCVEGFFRRFGRAAVLSRNNRFLVASIGPVTSQTCSKLGLRVDIEAKQFTLEGLCRAILDHYRTKK